MYDAAQDAVGNVWAAALECLKETSDEGYGIETNTSQNTEKGMSFMYMSDVDGSRVKVTITAEVV